MQSLLPLFLLAVYWVFIPFFLGAQGKGKSLNYRVSRLSTADGLPHNRIQELFEDQYGFLWVGTPQGLVRYDGYEFRVFNPQGSDGYDSSLLTIDVNAIAEEPDGDLWIGCYLQNKGDPQVYHFDRKTETFTPFFVDSLGCSLIQTGGVGKIVVGKEWVWVPTGRGVWRVPVDSWAVHGEQLQPKIHGFDMLRDAQDRIWIGSFYGIYQWLPEADSFGLDSMPLDRRPLISQIGETSDGKLWLCVSRGPGVEWWYLDPHTGTYERQETEPIWPDYLKNIVRVMPTGPKEGQFWLAQFVGEANLIQLDAPMGQVTPIQLQPDDGRELPLEWVSHLLEDRRGVIWIGSEEGLLKCVPRLNMFFWPELLRKDKEGTPIHVTGMAQHPDGSFWLTTKQAGLIRWDKEQDQVKFFPKEDAPSRGPQTDQLAGLTITSEGDVWFGEVVHVGRLDPVTEQFRHYYGTGWITDIGTDQKGQVWLTREALNMNGLERYDEEQDTFLSVKFIHPHDSGQIPNLAVTSIYEASEGKLWLGGASEQEQARGLYRYDPTTSRLERFEVSPRLTFANDRQHRVWMGGRDRGRLMVFHPDSQRPTYFSREHELPNRVVQSLTRDRKGNIWIGHLKGLSCFSPTPNTLHHYLLSDGVPFIGGKKVALCDEEGWLYFGGKQGLYYFHPDSLRDNPVPPQLVITQLSVDGEPLVIDSNGPLRQSLTVAQQITLAHTQNDLSIRYAGLHFQNPEQNHYRVWLENYDEDWREVGTRTEATYTNLDPGDYVFHFRAANSDGVWSEAEATLAITIRPPWYWNGWSQILYALLLLGLGYAFYRFQLRRRLAIHDAQRLAEMDRFKTRFYTNITHEFRTPLTNIQGMAEQIEAKAQARDIIQRNAAQLLTLVNQMLDLSKLEVSQLELNLQQGDVVPYLSYVVESFHSAALTQQVNLNFYAHSPAIVMDHDPERLRQVLANLVSNALKFTGPYGKVQVTARAWAADEPQRPTEGLPGEQLEIQVKDTGAGIEAAHLPHLFDRFFQAEGDLTRRAEGTGIGLALCQELVQLMGGKIWVESEVGEGSTFGVLLPITRRAPQGDPHLARAAGAASETLPAQPVSRLAAQADAPLLLVVEDNRDVRTYLRTCLEQDYQLLFARHGREGIDVAQERVPDLIISDVMMPEVDGLELCQTLKEDERTSHIPIVLLTAKSTHDDRLAGLETGADAYLIKPFSQEELHVRLSQLHVQRQRLRERFAQGLLPEAPPREDLDAQFLHRFRALIEQRLADPSLTGEAMAEAMAMSRMQLHRKVKALAWESPARYLRRMRMQHARELLQRTDLTVSQVADRVGYSEAGHFTRAYKAEFGMVPSER